MKNTNIGVIRVDLTNSETGSFASTPLFYLYCCMEILVCSVIGLVFTIWGIISYKKGDFLREHGKKVQGEVVDIIKERSKDSNGYYQNYYYPVVSFKTALGESVRKKLDFGSTSSFYARGQEVSIVYDPENPYNCNINSKFLLFGLPIILISIGLICMTLAMAFYIEVL